MHPRNCCFSNINPTSFSSNAKRRLLKALRRSFGSFEGNNEAPRIKLKSGRCKIASRHNSNGNKNGSLQNKGGLVKIQCNVAFPLKYFPAKNNYCASHLISTTLIKIGERRNIKYFLRIRRHSAKQML